MDANAVGNRSPCATTGIFPDCAFVISPPITLRFSLLRDSYDSIEESDQIFPGKVVKDHHGYKCQREVYVVNLHHTEAEQAMGGGFQEAQAASEEESRRR
jgi:hypothetical protein